MSGTHWGCTPWGGDRAAVFDNGKCSAVQSMKRTHCIRAITGAETFNFLKDPVKLALEMIKNMAHLGERGSLGKPTPCHSRGTGVDRSALKSNFLLASPVKP